MKSYLNSPSCGGHTPSVCVSIRAHFFSRPSFPSFPSFPTFFSRKKDTSWGERLSHFSEVAFRSTSHQTHFYHLKNDLER
ncbi:MAG: hypothetical protein HC817_05150 [Saprospiraceae bacterium]|nr:hypothetical protein [Saprospiraceae bacterium]